MKRGKVIVIGSGLGGLECGYILAKAGYYVIVLERHRQIGGCLQTFRRLDYLGHTRLFDTGLHYVGGLNEGGSLRPLFEYFDLMGLPWKRMDAECSDEVVIGDESFSLASGHERFAETLIERFPSEAAGIKSYTAFLKSVGDNIFRPFKSDGQAMNELFSKSAYEFLCSTVSDPLLRKVLSGASLKLELQADTLPLYVFAQINNSFIQSSWRLEGGGSQIATHLANSIEAMGGCVKTSSWVTKIGVEGGRATGVEVNGDEFLYADWVISDAHPAETLSLVPENKAVRRIYRSRITGLPNTFGMFTVNICLKPGTLKYLNRNIFVHTPDADLWRPDPSKTESVMVHFYPPEDGGEYATHLDLLSPMSYDTLAEWRNFPVERRGPEYEDIKRRKAEECIALVSRRLPELRGAIKAMFTSSPLTYLSYTLTPQGTAYGVRKDFSNPMGTILSPRSPLENLLFTGQNLNLHGILGVSMTSVLTSSVIAGISEELLGRL